MTKRWAKRPEGSTCGTGKRMTSGSTQSHRSGSRVARGRRGANGRDLLADDAKPAESLIERRKPPVLSPTKDQADVFGQQFSQLNELWFDVVDDDQVTLAMQYATQRDPFAHVGAEFDIDEDGEEELVFYNGYQTGMDIIGPEEEAGRDGRGHRSYAHRLGDSAAAEPSWRCGLARHADRDPLSSR